MCSCSTLSDGNCDPGTQYVGCDTQECQWDGGDCGFCSSGCNIYVGWESSLGNGVCDAECNTEGCYWDMGDCVTEDNPVEVYVRATATAGPALGTWTSPYTSIVTALTTAWAPFTVIHLLSGVHSVHMPGVNSTQLLSLSGSSIQIKTLFCTGSTDDHLDCASEPATIQLTKTDLNFLITSTVLIQDLTIRGGFSLVENCDSDYCTYCPSVHLNVTTGLMHDDRNLPIGTYATQEKCDKYQTSALFQLSPDSTFHLINVRFDTIRHQPLAVILNQCGHLILANVTFSNIVPRRLGLSGGVIQQTTLSSYEPYYCGSFIYDSGTVELLNNGYEYSQSNLFSGFAWLTALYSIHISQVTFQYNYIQIGKSQQIYGSSLMFIRRFRQMQVVNCTFKYNIADTGAAFYIYTALTMPLVPVNGVAAEQLLMHLIVQDNYFLGNTGRDGSIIYIQFMSDRQNILMKNNTFLDNFATEGGILVLSYGDLKDKYTLGQNVTVLVGGTLENVFIPPITTAFQDLSFISNYGPVICLISGVAHFSISNATFIDDGDSLAGLTSYEFVVGAFAINSDIYMQLDPPKIAPNACTATFIVQDSFNLTARNIVFQGLICTKGSPGFALSGSTRYVSDM